MTFVSGKNSFFENGGGFQTKESYLVQELDLTGCTIRIISSLAPMVMVHCRYGVLLLFVVVDNIGVSRYSIHPLLYCQATDL